ncbi:GTP cyclohydrolase II [Fructobacillus tropaeoli]|uniref:GTP cyclohydrolase II n=1 Tax=Fructobacillus tropaeoli TaxID=709323 RepID=UPI0019404D9D|nr:GTP cyclohydrolase II [Fructobacillus tropaeoli]GIC69624.1 bifunctional 3,4-dihydroxy-2-butanone-4-phosphate synthase/GTP cyclohydrolase II [Fructobacillus tropaeoli]
MSEKIRRALAALQRGELIIVQDDHSRENEGDLVGLAALASPAKINQALSIGRGVLCAPMTADRAQNLDLPEMVQQNSEKFGTRFTVAVDHVATTTGVSANDRAQTLRELANLSAKATDFDRPGHIFPLIAAAGGLKERQGHTEAAVTLAELAGVPPVAYIIEILREDGKMARQEDLAKLAKDQGLEYISIRDIRDYIEREEGVELTAGPRVTLPTRYGQFFLTDFIATGQEREPDLLLESSQQAGDVPLVRVHSECDTGDLFGSKRCECGPQLEAALSQIGQEGGAVVYLRQEGRGIGLHDKLKAYLLQENGYDTVEANLALGHQADERNYERAALMLKQAGLTKIRLLTNNLDKVAALRAYGIDVVDRVPLEVGQANENTAYLQTKAEKLGQVFTQYQI